MLEVLRYFCGTKCLEKYQRLQFYNLYFFSFWIQNAQCACRKCDLYTLCAVLGINTFSIGAFLCKVKSIPIISSNFTIAQMYALLDSTKPKSFRLSFSFEAFFSGTTSNFFFFAISTLSLLSFCKRAKP